MRMQIKEIQNYYGSGKNGYQIQAYYEGTQSWADWGKVFLSRAAALVSWNV